ncbi:MAG: GNAT family N-acetyltransferase [Limnochordales bacterium]|nr:GNAT family N-acetyltransferase [Limnochordales bacterium]
MQGPFPARACEVAAAADLSNRVFRPASQFVRGTMHLEFPLVFSEEHPENLWIMKDGEKVVSLVGLLERPIFLFCHPIRTAALGTVCTDPDYRGRGLASQILQKLMQHLRQRGVRLLIISGNRSLYRRIGAVTAGLVRWVSAPARKASAEQREGGWTAESWVVREATPQDLPWVLRLYERESVRFARSLSDLRAFYSALPHAYAGARFRQLWVAEASGGEVTGGGAAASGEVTGRRGSPLVAYLVTDGPAPATAGVGHGVDDSPPIWYALEWGGARQVVWQMARTLAARHQVVSINFPLPETDVDLALAARQDGVDVDSLPLASWSGTFVALDPAGLVSDLSPLLGCELTRGLTEALARGSVTGETLPAILFGASKGWWDGDRQAWAAKLSELTGVSGGFLLEHPLPLPLVWGSTLNFV